MRTARPPQCYGGWKVRAPVGSGCAGLWQTRPSDRLFAMAAGGEKCSLRRTLPDLRQARRWIDGWRRDGRRLGRLHPGGKWFPFAAAFELRWRLPVDPAVGKPFQNFKALYRAIQLLVGAYDAIFPRLVKVALLVSDRLLNALRLLGPGRCRSDGLHLRHPAVGIGRRLANFELGKFHFAQVELGQFRRSQVQGFGSGLPG